MSLMPLVVVAAAAAGAMTASLVNRRTDLAPANWLLAFAVSLLVAAGPHLAFRSVATDLATLAVLAWSSAGSMLAYRWRRSALGGAGELRDHELARVMIWDWERHSDGTRRYIASQGELVVERKWPEELPFVPLSSSEEKGRVPRGQGRHLLVLGGTGSGKTVSADRVVLGRVLADRVPAFVLDPKGDERLHEDLSALAAAVERPFVLFDPFSDDSDCWNPTWSHVPGRTVAKLLAPIQTSEPYYADVLRIHLGVVSEMLRYLGMWPASVPLLLDAAQPHHFAVLREKLLDVGGPPELMRMVEGQNKLVESSNGQRDIGSGAARLRVVAGTSWRSVLTPRADGRAVQLPEALKAGAIVLWRTWVEDLPEEAEAITTLALADLIASAGEGDGREWLAMLDEFGSVMQGNAATRALGLLGRARSAGGQAIVVTQSAADVPTATESPSMLEALADNFSGFVVHRQTSAESREWVAKLMGTRELWQSTDRMKGGGRFAEGTGSRRRVREFRVRPDELKDLAVGEAFVWSPGGPLPERVEVAMAPQLRRRESVSNEAVYRHAGLTRLSQDEKPQRQLGRSDDVRV